MRPILFEIFGFPFASWYVFFALAGIGAFLYVNALLAGASRIGKGNRAENADRAREGWPGLFALCYVAGWVGARAFSIWREQIDVTTAGAFFAELGRVGPMTFYGGAVFATLVGVIYAAVRRLPMGILFDTVVPAGALALGLGRIGCHLNGDDFGAPVPAAFADAWWTVTFPNLADGVARWPVQLEEAVFSIALATLAAILFRNAPVGDGTIEGGKAGESTSGGAPTSPTLRLARVFLVPGTLGAAVAAVSALHRFGNEFYRGDPRGTFLGSTLSTSQGIALIVFFVSSVLLVWRRMPADRPAPRR